MKRTKLIGNVFSGQGEGKNFLELPWVKQQIQEKLGFTPYPGTLNLMLSEKSMTRIKLFENAPSIKLCSAKGYCNGKLIKASIAKIECAIVIPEVAGYPKNALEIIAPVNLKEALKLEDGSEVTVAVNQ